MNHLTEREQKGVVASFWYWMTAEHVHWKRLERSSTLPVSVSVRSRQKALRKLVIRAAAGKLKGFPWRRRNHASSVIKENDRLGCNGEQGSRLADINRSWIYADPPGAERDESRRRLPWMLNRPSCQRPESISIVRGWIHI